MDLGTPEANGPANAFCTFAVQWSRSAKITETARLGKIDIDKPHVHHDAPEFPNGEVVLLTRLAVGQMATVLQLLAPPGGATARRQSAFQFA